MYPATIGKHTVRFLRLCIRAVLLLIVAAAMQASAQKTTITVTAQTAPKVKQNSITYTSPDSGQQMYAAYCAVCHGADAKASSHAAQILVPRPTDLTTLSSRNGGKFPADHVKYRLVDLDLYSQNRATDMPCWGPALKSLSKSNPDLFQLRVHNLVAYLEKMQAPSAKAGIDPGSPAKPR